MHLYRRLTEASRCPPPPSWRALQQSKARYACGPPPHTVGVPAGVPHHTVVCGGPQPDGDGGRPDRAGVSHREPRHPGGPRGAALHRGAGDPLPARAHARSGRPTQKSLTCLWRVPHPGELCDPRRHAPGQPRHHQRKRRRFKAGRSPNIPENPRNRKRTKRGRKRFFNAAGHALRLRVERTFAWEDKFKRLLLRFERIQQRH